MNLTREEKIAVLITLREKVEQLQRKELNTHITLEDAGLVGEGRIRVAKSHEEAKRELEVTKRALAKMMAAPALG